MKFQLIYFVIGCYSFLSLSAAHSLETRTIYPKRSATVEALCETFSLSSFRSILDIGCGEGAITTSMAEQTTGSVLGIDRELEAIEFAQNTCQNSNVSFEVMDARQWEFSEDRFDLITSFHTLHWFDNLPVVMPAIARSLTKNGLLVVAMAHTEHFLYKSVRFVAQDSRWKSYFEDPDLEPWFGYNPESIDCLLKKSGLQPTKIEIWYKQLAFDSRAQFTAWLKSWIHVLPHFFQLPNDVHDQFLDDIVDHFFSGIIQKADGSFFFSTPLLVFIAKK